MKKQVKSYINSSEVKVAETSGNAGERIATIKGVATFMKEDRDGEIVDVKNAEIDYIDGTIPFMRDHQHNNASESTVGIVKDMKVLSDRIEFEAEVHEKADEVFFYKLMHGIIKSCSIGFFASEYDVEEHNDKRVGVLKGIKIFELSATPLASNTSATFSVTGTKSLMIKQSVEALKEANPDCDGFSCKVKSASKKVEKEKDMREELKEAIEKALTIEETEASTWNREQMIMHQMHMMMEVLDDNFWAERWGDIEKPEMLQNVRDAFEKVQARIEELLTVEMENNKQSNGEQVKTKETVTEEVADATEEKVEDQEVSEVTGEESQEELTPSEPEIENSETEEKEPEVQVEANQETPTETEEEKTETPDPVQIINNFNKLDLEEDDFVAIYQLLDKTDGVTGDIVQVLANPEARNMLKETIEQAIIEANKE